MSESLRNSRAETTNITRTALEKSIQKRRNNAGTNGPRSKRKETARET
jgi:hypothetical protein